MISEQLLATTCTSLNVASAGDGAPLVLLHGVTRRWQDFSALAPSLIARWRIVAPDFRGHGLSDRVPGAYAVVDYAGDAVSLLERHVDQPAIVFGHSLGAMVALAVAASVPERVRGLILEEPPFETMGARIEQAGLLDYFTQLQRIAGSGASVPELGRALAEVRVMIPGASQATRLGDVRDAASLRFAANCLAAADPEIFGPIVERRWLAGYDYRRMFDRVRCPTLLLQGDPALGGMLMDDDVAAALAGIRDCTHVRVSNVGHHIHSQMAEVTQRIVHAFLESL